MLIQDMLNALKDFTKLNKGILQDLELSEETIIDAKCLWDKDEPLRQARGIYLFVDRQGGILYIGKGELGARVWSHLKVPSKGPSNIYQKHEWSNIKVHDAIKKTILDGDFSIYALLTTPHYTNCLFEVYALTLYKYNNSKLPPLNNQIC